MFFQLALKSLLWRKGSVLLAVLAITVSIFVLLGVNHIRNQAKTSFNSVVSGVDLIVGARTGDINLLLYSVFHLGQATQNIGWNTYQKIVSQSDIEWAIPISLGDSHQGYRVIGTESDFYRYYQYGQQQSLRFFEGREFTDVFDVVLGAEVAKNLHYQLGDKVVLAHGIAKTSFSLHDDKPFRVVGILAPTGTPIDQSLQVSLEAITAIHLDWKNGVKIPGQSISQEQIKQLDLKPKTITAMMLGLKSKMATFRVQRAINDYQQEALLAILPGVTLSRLWQVTGTVEKTLSLVSSMVLLAALLGLSAMLLASIRERQQEIAVMRAVGASPSFIFMLIEFEAVVISLGAFISAVLLLAASLVLIEPYLIEHYNLYLSTSELLEEAGLIGLLVLFSAISVALLPAMIAYKQALQTQLGGR